MRSSPVSFCGGAAAAASSSSSSRWFTHSARLELFLGFLAARQISLHTFAIGSSNRCCVESMFVDSFNIYSFLMGCNQHLLFFFGIFGTWLDFCLNLCFSLVCAVGFCVTKLGFSVRSLKKCLDWITCLLFKKKIHSIYWQYNFS